MGLFRACACAAAALAAAAAPAAAKESDKDDRTKDKDSESSVAIAGGKFGKFEGACLDVIVRCEFKNQHGAGGETVVRVPTVPNEDGSPTCSIPEDTAARLGELAKGEKMECELWSVRPDDEPLPGGGGGGGDGYETSLPEFVNDLVGEFGHAWLDRLEELHGQHWPEELYRVWGEGWREELWHTLEEGREQFDQEQEEADDRFIDHLTDVYGPYWLEGAEERYGDDWLEGAVERHGRHGWRKELVLKIKDEWRDHLRHEYGRYWQDALDALVDRYGAEWWAYVGDLDDQDWEVKEPYYAPGDQGDHEDSNPGPADDEIESYWDAYWEADFHPPDDWYYGYDMPYGDTAAMGPAPGQAQWVELIETLGLSADDAPAALDEILRMLHEQAGGGEDTGLRADHVATVTLTGEGVEHGVGVGSHAVTVHHPGAAPAPAAAGASPAPPGGSPGSVAASGEGAKEEDKVMGFPLWQVVAAGAGAFIVIVVIPVGVVWGRRCGKAAADEGMVALPVAMPPPPNAGPTGDAIDSEQPGIYDAGDGSYRVSVRPGSAERLAASRDMLAAQQGEGLATAPLTDGGETKMTSF